ncbi:hypothetical protein [Streptomyces sp. MB09-02B]|uniref:hypothetical protein n=1 Tax=Streptomyces sp. MB09-02B TaxID=3028667 RepID=UPI0029A91560|nr:hypothetical protein [Streptomyces sp. MB09-02B]MDX3644640.1 hypothetical protein [Streptomyces sp. MB09-02B]
MRFIIRADKAMVVAFEPTAAEFSLEPGKKIIVEWLGGGEDGMVSLEAGTFVVAAPTGGHTRAWDADGVEIYVGPDSGPEAR